MLTIDIVQGCQKAYDLRANLTSGAATADLLIGDTFAAKVWAGGNQPSLFAPAVVYLSASSVTLTITAAQSLALNYGQVYPVEIYRTRSAITDCIGYVLLTVLPAPR